MTRQLILFASMTAAFSAFGSGCPLKVPNVPIYADKGARGAVVAYTRGDEGRQQVKKADWDRVRVGMFCMNAEALGDYQTFIEMACQGSQSCVDGVRRVIKNLKE